jgi:hypothetical protein
MMTTAAQMPFFFPAHLRSDSQHRLDVFVLVYALQSNSTVAAFWFPG